VVALGILIGLLTVLIETIMAKCKRAVRIAQFNHSFDRNDQNGDGYRDELSVLMTAGARLRAVDPAKPISLVRQNETRGAAPSRRSKLSRRPR
jgi:hypothetical protein